MSTPKPQEQTAITISVPLRAILPTLLFAICVKYRTAIAIAVAVCPAVTGQEVWKSPMRKDSTLEYHPIPSDAIAIVASIPQSSKDLRSDGMGAYWQGNDTVRSYFGAGGVNWNFFTYWPETTEEPLPRKLRFLQINLDSPEPGAKPMGIVRDQTAMLHVFPQVGTAIRDVDVGQTVEARRVLLRFHRDDKIYFLRMGTEPFTRPLLWEHIQPGQGSTTATITRESRNKWIISAPHGSLARLSMWTTQARESAAPIDLGLYHFSFEIHLQVQRPPLPAKTPNKAPEPTPGSVTPRATESKAK